MAAGTLFFVIGPSGSGKDTLIEGAKAALSAGGRYVFARRVITRAAGSPGEDHDGVTAASFAELERAGHFLIAWDAHGLRYGLLAALAGELESGRHVIANGSRAMVADLAARVGRLVVIEVTAPKEILAERLRRRGRETAEDIRRRLDRQVPELPAGIEVVRVVNDGLPEIGVERFLAVLDRAASRFRLRRLPIDTGRPHTAFLPADSRIVTATDYLGPGRIDIGDGVRSIRAQVAVVEAGTLLGADELGLSSEAFEDFGRDELTRVSISRTPSPESRDALRRKVRGGELTEVEYERVVRDIVEGRYPDSEIAGFLVAANQRLTDDEVLSLARVRHRFSNPIRWDEPIVVDKHSMGGIPGSRITLIVVPIVAAHGLAIPKTSSRAITSAAGTADAMETVARVDLGPDEVRATVRAARGCVAWNGRLSHSPLDDVMNAITRPLGIDSNRWSVASILSKKLAAGSTHVVIDLPYGPHARIHSEAEATQLARLFETVGAGLGLTVKAIPTDGTRPIGRGIGPALEVRDVSWVLDGHPDAPTDLRDKALAFASRIIAWDPAIGDEAAALRRATALLASGAARRAFDAIIDAQGRRPDPVLPGPLVHTLRAERAGTIRAIDGWAIAGIARRAGAPNDKAAGLDLLRRVGDSVSVGEPLFVIHSTTATDLDAAIALAFDHCGFVFDGSSSAPEPGFDSMKEFST
ncbi:MAG TPA: phosphonate metabolism protein/1,5-bisphosphokinase (PRPP-forming) PhnN [Stellaceae bacterium]|nr:phosphonate metabolism protein/1,5-bisphosphokinase (PRPP-forming) PhnN [Stellaceae bacterium]